MRAILTAALWTIALAFAFAGAAMADDLPARHYPEDYAGEHWPTPSIGAGNRSPAIVTDRSREPLLDHDFLRITFLPSSVTVTTPSRPSALRAFFGASRFYEPPIAVDEIADFNGFAANAANDLVAMRCRPQTTLPDPVLATWPNLAKMITGDLATKGYTCPPTQGPANEAYCLAHAYADVPAQPIVNGLVAALQFGQQLFALGSFVGDSYGINASHSGLGFVVRGPAAPLPAGEALKHLVVPEYLLKNLNLASANCRCIRVPPYAGRDQDLLPVELVWRRGQLGHGGVCSAQVSRLPRGFR